MRAHSLKVVWVWGIPTERPLKCSFCRGAVGTRPAHCAQDNFAGGNLEEDNFEGVTPSQAVSNRTARNKATSEKTTSKSDNFAGGTLKSNLEGDNLEATCIVLGVL